MNISDKTPVNFESSLKVTKVSLCRQKANQLHALELEIDISVLNPGKVANSVLTKSDTLTLKEKRQLPYYVLQEQFQQYNPELCKNVLSDYSETNRFISKLFRSWVFNYNLETEAGKLVLNFLKKKFSTLSASERDMANKLGLLGGDKTNTIVVNAILQKEITSELLDKIGLSNGVTSTKFARSLLTSIVSFVMKNQISPTELKALKQIFAPNNQVHESVKSEAMVALIFSVAKESVTSESSQMVRKIIQNSYLDPRFHRYEWPSVSEVLGGQKTRDLCMEQVKKWQVFQSIVLFFQIIEDVVERDDASHHFPIRREFWIRYFNQGAVTDAWVVLGKKASSRVRKLIATGDPEYKMLSWADLEGANHDQSVLMMKVGNLTIIEWSHSGACRIWRNEDVQAPVMNKKNYHREDFMKEATHRIVHDSGKKWQGKLTRVINNDGGLRSVV